MLNALHVRSRCFHIMYLSALMYEMISVKSAMQLNQNKVYVLVGF